MRYRSSHHCFYLFTLLEQYLCHAVYQNVWYLKHLKAFYEHTTLKRLIPIMHAIQCNCDFQTWSAVDAWWSENLVYCNYFKYVSLYLKSFWKKNVNECHYIWWNVLSLRINVRFILRLSCCIQAIIKITLRQLKNLTRCQMETEWHYNWKCCCSAFWWVKHINACWERLDMKLEWHIWRYARTRV